jgi:enediyne biosynthesis protein E4
MNTKKVWSSLAFMASLGALSACSSEQVTAELGTVSQPATQVVFTDATADSGISGGEGSWAAVWGDYDGDGDLDVFGAIHLQDAVANNQTNKLFENDGDGTFTDVTVTAGVEKGYDSHGAGWADLDNDGDLDLAVIQEPIFDRPNTDELDPQTQLYDILWRNNGNDTFTDVAEESGILDHEDDAYGHLTRGVSAVDYDLDGLLDLTIAVHSVPAYGDRNLLFNNLGDLAFEDVADEAGVAHATEEKRAVVWADYNNDGYPDLFVSPPCALYENNKDGTFTDVTVAAGITGDTVQAQSVAVSDYDHDGDLDFFSSRGFNADADDILYENQGDGTFTDVTTESGIAALEGTDSSRGAVWADYDNDGDEDLYVVALKGATKPNHLYQNQGDGTFTDVAEAAGVETVDGNGMDASFADYDGDGFLDLLRTAGEGNPTAAGPWVLFHNEGNENHWLELELVGTESNRQGIMSRVAVTSGGTERCYVYSGTHWLAQDASPLHVGLGDETAAERVSVVWPSGIVDVLDDVTGDQLVTVVEGDNADLTVGTPCVSALGSGSGGGGGAGGAAGADNGGGTSSGGNGEGGEPSANGGASDGGSSAEAGQGSGSGGRSSGGESSGGESSGGESSNGGSGEDDSGCGCSVPGKTTPASWLSALVLGVLLVARRRRSAF